MMRERKLTKLYLRFRKTRDPESLARIFDECAPDLLRLAHHLSPQAADAEDLVQATFLAMIESVDRFRPGEMLFPWLVGILTNQARRARARSNRRPDPQRLVTREPREPGGQVAEREVFDNLESAIHGLARPYREVLEKLVATGKSTAEIASDLGRSPSTVRTQLSRGCRMLRAMLPEGAALGIPLVRAQALSEIRETVLSKVPGRIATAGRVPRVRRLTWRHGVVAAAFVSLAVPLILLFRTRPDEAPLRAPSYRGTAQEVPSDDTGQIDIDDTSRHGPPPLANESASAKKAPPPQRVRPVVTGDLRLRVRDPQGAPVGPSLLLLRHLTSKAPRLRRLLESTTDEHGEFVATGLPPGLMTAYLADRRKLVQFEIHSGDLTEVSVTIDPGVTIRGRVVDSYGSGLAGAAIFLNYSRRAGWRICKTDAEGRFEFTTATSNFISARLAGYPASSMLLLSDLSPAERNDLTIPLEGVESTLSGRVVDESGNGLEGARIRLIRRPVPGRPIAGKKTRSSFKFSTWSDPSGRFALASLAPGQWLMNISHEGFVPHRRTFEMKAGGHPMGDIPLEVGFRLSGLVVDASGEPLKSVHVYYLRDEQEAAVTRTNAQGAYAFDALPVGQGTLRFVRVDVGERRVAVTGRSGQVLRRSVRIGSRSAIQGKLEDQSGRPLGGWLITARALTRWGEPGFFRRVRSSDDGDFVLDNLIADVAYRIDARNADEALPRATMTGVFPDTKPVTLVTGKDTASLHGVVVDEDGRGISGAALVLEAEGVAGAWKATSDATGRFGWDALPEGHWIVAVVREGYRVVIAAPATSPGERVDLGPLKVQSPGRLRLARDEKTVEDARLHLALLRRETGTARMIPTDLVDGKTSIPLAPGAYSLHLGGLGFPCRVHSFTIRSGEETRIPITVRSGAEMKARSPDTTRLDFPPETLWRLSDPSGSPILSRMPGRHGPRTCPMMRAAGTLSLEWGAHNPSRRSR
ncbi:MAG TPA: sigma-70 family RNA polymerase sigma factor [Planctomycetes bacterium]|nr:sigma-70 family RNA polymerase sigma factor [Planctomycetota bacterium]